MELSVTDILWLRLRLTFVDRFDSFLLELDDFGFPVLEEHITLTNVVPDLNIVEAKRFLFLQT